jgi:hypothetical protein
MNAGCEVRTILWDSYQKETIVPSLGKQDYQKALDFRKEAGV